MRQRTLFNTILVFLCLTLLLSGCNITQPDNSNQDNNGAVVLPDTDKSEDNTDNKEDNNPSDDNTDNKDEDDKDPSDDNQDNNDDSNNDNTGNENNIIIR